MSDTPGDDAPLRYYDGDGADPLAVVLDALRESGRDVERLEIDDLAAVDEFHALGRPATMALAELAGVQEGAAVIDVGAGLGGPARFLAARYGAHVTAVEPTRRFRDACAELTRRAGLAERVRTRGKVRERLVELFTERPIERLSVLHTTEADVEEFAAEITRRAGLEPSQVTIDLVGASVGPHLGPGCVGGVALYKAS